MDIPGTYAALKTKQNSKTKVTALKNNGLQQIIISHISMDWLLILPGSVA